MTSVEKRRSGRRSGGHRKHSDGGFSDTSSAGSFLDETDREVSNLTDRAFRSLCIGDEAVYNDSDLGASSPCTQRDRQLAFSQSAQEREREELKRAAHESFSLRMQQYGQEWIHRGMYGAEIQRDPQWEGYEERTQGRVSATFQHSFVETSQPEESLTGEQLPLLSNGATEVSTQQRRSRSRVSSLIRAFNSDGQRDGAVTDGKQRDWNDETSWDKSALMSIQRELSEFSTSYQENFNSGHYPSAGQYSAQNTDLYSSEVAAMTQVNPGSSFMRSSHSKHNMSAQVNCNSNFFIHSEFSPFKVWRDHNRFPFQQGEVSGFMHYPDFPKWYETPMYRELSLEAQSQIPYRFEEREMRYMRNNMAPVVPPTPPRATSTSTMLQRAPAVEKRCDSELTGHYPYRKRAQSLGANRLPTQRPSTASPTVEMSRRVQDTISSVRALQQKIKMMTEQNIITAMPTTHQGVSYNNDNLNSYGNYAQTATPNVVSSNTSTTPFNISQLLTPAVHIHQETDTLDIRQHAVSPQLVEHAPVRAESRGATPDVRMSSYKSRATSLLFNLKDNRKRVKSTYSPPKFKGLETQEKNKQPLIQEPRDTVIDMPDFTDADPQYPQVEGSNWTNAASHHYVNQYQSLGATNYEPATAHAGPYSEYTSSNYQTAQMQGEMVHHSGFTGFIPENYTSNQLANGQNLYEDLSSFTPYKQGMTDNVVTQGGDGYRHKLSYAAVEPPRVNADNHQIREYLINNANTVQHFNETMGRVDGYQQFSDNSYGYGNVSMQDVWRHPSSHDMNAAIPPWAQEKMASMVYEEAYQSAAMTNEEANLPRDKHGHVNQQVFHNEQEKNRLGEGLGTSHALDGFVPPYDSNQLTQYGGLSNNTEENQVFYGYQQLGTAGENYGLQKESGHITENKTKDENIPKMFNRLTEEEHSHHPNKDFLTLTQEPGQQKQPILNGYEMQNSQQVEFQPQFQHNMQNNAYPDNLSDLTLDHKAKDRKSDEVKAEQAMALHVKAQHAQAELALAQHWAKEQQPKDESAELNLAGQTGPDKAKEEEKEGVNQARADDERRKDSIIETLTEKQPEKKREVETKEEQTLMQKVTQPSYITEEAGAEHMKEEQDEQVKVEQAEAQTLKEEPIKTELAETGQAGIQPRKRAESEAEQLEEEKLRAEQLRRERIEAEKIRIEKSKAEWAEEQRQKEEQEKQQLIKEQAKAEEKAKDGDKDLIQAPHQEDTNPTSQIKEAKVEKLKEKEKELVNSKEIEVNATKPELINTEKIQDRLAEPAPKLTSSQPVKSEPDKVEQAKTELAKAKAELAKIKEKMKVKNTAPTKDDEVKKDVSVTAGKDKNEDKKCEDQATKPEHQQSKDLDVNSIQGLDEYKRLREKYGFIDTPIATTTITSAVSSNETPVLTLDKFETNVEISEGKISPPSEFKTSNTENKDEVSSFESHEGTESQYIYSESSKEFKLSSGGNIFTSVVTKTDPVTDKVKEDKAEKLEKHDQPIQPDVSKQRDTNLAIQLPVERKPKSTEHSVGPSKDPHLNPPKALSHKERAQTKQEILTSKIKAHAEKEISAIKEKGFAKRDGLSSKTSTKQLGGGQIMNARQKPPSQEAPKKYDSTTPSNTTPKHQTEPQGIQMTAVKPVSSSSSAAMSVKSGATSSQSVDHTQNVLKEPIHANVTKPTKEDKLTGIQPLKTENNFADSKNEETQSSTQSKELSIKNQQIKQESSRGENSANKANELKDRQALDSVSLIRENEPKPLAEVNESHPSANEKSESKNEALLGDSVPTLSLVLGGNHTSAVDDSLQIRGIMVTVRQRKPSLSSDEISQITPDQTHVTVKESSNSGLKECPKSTAPEETKGDKLSEEFTKVETTEKDVQGTNPAMAKVGQKIHPENVQGASVLETSQNNLFNNVTGKSPDVKQEIQAGDAKPRRETQLHEPLAEKGSPSTVTVPAKNKALAETQTLPYNQDIIPRETKDLTNETQMKSIKTDEVKNNTQENISQKRPTEHTNENFTPKVVNNVFHEADIEALTKPNIQPSVKDDMKTNINHTSGSYVDSKSAPLLEKEKHHSTPVNKTGSSENSTDKRVPQDENIQLDDDIHIDSIAIRVVPAVTEDYTGKAEKHHAKPAPSAVIAATDQKQDISSKEEGQLMNDNITKDPVAVSCQRSLEDNSSVQNVLSSVKKLSDSLKNNSQKENVHAAPQNIKAENEQPGGEITSRNVVNKPKIPPTEEDYFQVQGIAATDPKLDRNAKMGTIGATSERREPPGLQSNKAVSGQKSNSEVGKEAFVLDQSLRKIAEMNSASFQEEEVKKNNKETEENLASKHNNGPTERQSTTNEKSEASQAAHIRKHHTENRRERQRNTNPARDNAAAEKAEAKPTPKPRASTIPDISALADYARLKVIVSEDRENPIQEFPPNKKEGFFPLIQSRHSRRPVFNVDPQDFTVKEKAVPNKTEVSSKANKEPKPLVFPITDKEHQRTGMFKLGEKEKHDKLHLNAKAKEETQIKHAQNIQERIKSPTTPSQKKGMGEEVPSVDVKRPYEVQDSGHYSSNPPLKETNSSSASNRPTSISQQIKPNVSINPNEKPEEFSSSADRVPYLDKNSHSQGHNAEVSIRTSRKHQETGNVQEVLEKDVSGNLRQERNATQHEDTKAKQLEEEHNSTEDKKMKHIVSGSRASLAEEQRKAAQREEERRAREREAIANQIKERREKQKELDRKEEEERKREEAEKERTAKKEERIRAKQRQIEEKRVKEIREKWLMKDEEEKRRQVEAEEKRAAREEQQRRAAEEEQQRRAAQEEQKRAALEEQRKKAAQEEQQRRASEEDQLRRAAKEERQRRAVQEEQRRKAAEEEWQRRAAEEVQQRRAAEEVQQRRAAQEEQKRAVQEEQQKRAAEEEQQRRAVQEEQKRAALEEQQRKAAQEVQQRRAAQEEQKRAVLEEQQKRAMQEEQQRRAAQEVQQRRATQEEQQRRAALEEQQRKAAQEDQKRAALEEQQRRAAEEEQQRRTSEEDQLRRAAKEERQRRAVQEEQRRKAAEEEQLRRAAEEEEERWRAVQEEQRRKAAEEEQLRRAAEEEEERWRAVQEEQQRRAVQEEQQRRAAQEEQRKKAAQEEEERRRAAEEEQQRRAAEEEQQRRAVQEEQQRRAVQEEQQRRAVQEEQQRRTVQEEQQRRAVQEEQQRIAVQEEQRKKAAHVERERRRAAEEEQQRRQHEEQRRAALEEQRKRAAEEEKDKIRATGEEQQRRAALEEQRRKAAQQEQERRRAAEEEQQRKNALEEQRRKAAEIEQERRSVHEEQQRRAAKEEQMRAVLEEKKRKEAQEEHQRRRAAEEERCRRAAEEQQRKAQEEQERRTAQEEQHCRALQKEQERRDYLEEKQRRAVLKEQQARAVQEERQRRAVEEEQERRAAMEDQQRRAAEEEQQWRAALIEEQRQAKRIEEKILSDIEERKKQKQREKDRATQISDQERIKQGQEVNKREQHTDERDGRQRKEGRSKVFEKNQEDGERDKASERSEALQYYAITSTDSESKPRERQVFSPSPPQQRLNPTGLEPSEDPGSHSRSYRPHAAASPAPSLPRSNTSSPALGIKPSMFRVKDNTFRSSSFTKSVKPRFHKNFGEDFRVGSPMERGPERVEEEQETVRHSAGTPVHPDRQSSAHQPSQDYSAALPHRPFSRRSFALDEDDSRSVISNMSEGVESFATSVADLSELRGFYYDERPESACSFSSDMSRSMGRPPAVPPKSEKAMRRAKRLTSRRINKELSKAGADSSADVEKPHQDVSSIPSLSSSTEVRSTNRHVVASPHFAPPVSIAHAPTVESSLPSSRTEHRSSHSSFHATPHATAPISLPVATPHATAPVSLPVVSTHATGPAPNSAAPKTVTRIPSSPTPRRANPAAPVTQYHVESGYPPSYPLTQRKVLQDLGSGQYFVVDVPVQVKTKTFIDPETGKYVQLNVRESAQGAPRPQPKPQPQPAYHQPQLQPQTQVKPQQPNTQAPPAGKPAVLYEGYHGYPQGYQPAANKSALHHRSSAPATSHQEQQPVREGRVYGYPAPENRQNSEGPRYSPEKTPYMDTVNDSGRTYNRVYNTQGPYESLPESDTNSQLAGSPVCENDNSAHSRYQPREIITISELEDFMEVSDW